MESAQRQQQPPSSKGEVEAARGVSRTTKEDAGVLCPAFTKTVTRSTLARLAASCVRLVATCLLLARAHACARAPHLLDSPPRGRLAAHRYHALAVSLSHVTCGVACRPWGCSTRRQPMLRCATTTHRLHRCSQPCSRRDVGSHTHDTRRSRECPSPCQVPWCVSEAHMSTPMSASPPARRQARARMAPRGLEALPEASARS